VFGRARGCLARVQKRKKELDSQIKKEKELMDRLGDHADQVRQRKTTREKREDERRGGSLLVAQDHSSALWYVPK